MGSPTTPRTEAGRDLAAHTAYFPFEPGESFVKRRDRVYALIRDIEEAAARDALDRVRAAVEAIQPWPDNTLPRNEVLAILEPNIEDTQLDLVDGTAYRVKP